MRTVFHADRLDVAALAREQATIASTDALGDYRRLAKEACVPIEQQPLHWSARGELRSAAGRAAQPWLHLQADAALPLTCQRCLERVDIALTVDRWFRFVADEETAAAEDEHADEDVLELQSDFKLRALVEDELLLALPVVPLHDQCPVDVKLEVADPDFEHAESARENPFAALERLRPPDKPEQG